MAVEHGDTATARVLVTGVRGKTGAPLAELLVARPGVEVLGGSSDPEKVTVAGVRPTEFSWDRPDGWPAATDGVDALYVAGLGREAEAGARAAGTSALEAGTLTRGGLAEAIALGVMPMIARPHERLNHHGSPATPEAARALGIPLTGFETWLRHHPV